MARRGSRARQRDSIHIATPRVLPSATLRPIVRATLQLEDRRQWQPSALLRVAAIKHPQALRRSSARIVDRIGRRIRESLRRDAGILAFARPRDVSVCVRRKRRRQVLFAFQKTGKGARAPRRRNEWSSISCKR